MTNKVLLGDEAVALAAVHAGLAAAYAYPGTPSTELLEYLMRYAHEHGGPHAAWCSNEKTAYEEALGVSFAGRRALVAMKHVGLNVAADPFINSALVAINGGLVLVVADDPGMHSSQNEQDSRYYAEMAGVICLEPANQQQAYEMTREAFDLSENFHIPVMIRLVTRLAHSRSAVQTGEPRRENRINRPGDTSSWTLLPANARRRWRSLIQRQPDFLAYAESSPHNSIWLNQWNSTFGVITTGLAQNYFLENAGDLKVQPSHLHIGAYPLPVEKIRRLVDHVKRVLIFEEGQPFLETHLRGIVFTRVEIEGKQTGLVPPDGELTPDIVRAALGLAVREGIAIPNLHLPNRPPQLCAGCPHGDSFDALKAALETFPDAVVTSDIGCYTLGALPPYCAIETCVCMGASIGMAKGASEAGLRPAIAVIGDSTFLHSGVTGLMDAVAADTDMTLIILDNETVAMTGGQPTILASSRLEKLILALGVETEQFHLLSAHPKRGAMNTEVIRSAITHEGLSVIVMVRECVETAKRQRRAATQRNRTTGPTAGVGT
jgi:indolepyruvate ferredoxin oxidoreductase alpha subunit